MASQEELIAEVEQDIKGLSAQFDSEDYTSAATDAARETGWSFPTSDAFQLLWLKRRIKRNLYDMLRSESAHKFKFEGINLQDRFKHYSQLVKEEDEAFEAIQNAEPYKFAGVGVEHMFGSKLDGGFAYDQFGRDLTYDTENEVAVAPSSVDSE